MQQGVPNSWSRALSLTSCACVHIAGFTGRTQLSIGLPARQVCNQRREKALPGFQYHRKEHGTIRLETGEGGGF